MRTRSTVLSAHDLDIGYSSKKQANVIAGNINLSLNEGKLVALIGANGIGKSTLLRTLTSIQKPLKGSITLAGRAIETYSAETLAQQLSIVLTEALPPSNLSVHELVTLGRQPYTNWLGSLTEEDVQKVQNAIRLTQIDHILHKKHFEVSDGQLQKALIARALAQDTPLIILDEPTTHLDLLHKASLLKLLKKLCAETGKCILYSTHDLDLALQLSDEIIVMTEGNVVQGTVDNLITGNAFEIIFNDGSIKFDPAKRGFTIL